MNLSHEYNGIGFVFKLIKQPNYTHEENMAYIQDFLKEVHHAIKTSSTQETVRASFIGKRHQESGTHQATN